MAEVRTERKPTMPKGPMRGRGMPVPKGAIKKGTLKRLIKTLMKYYKWRMLIVLVCIVLGSVGSLVSSVYMQSLVDDVITPAMENAGGFTAELQGKLVGLILMMVIVYGIVILCNFI